MTPAAVVPVHTPEEAIEEATYAVRELGLKVIMIANHVRRPVPAAARGVADSAQRAPTSIRSASRVLRTTTRSGRSAESSGSR
jgi:hypothetical protein